ncbi:hypothetical protein EHS25_008936 [Saitozyma podzolica]|uniref:Alpha/beta hydrolase fold-3 domain-containing protein n=1 Tax=Saitozyma podzolica TaxID=1890683 RepID=A0A427YN94_9TREE|nr:hypothetical protein EHS25_008936 [Saitozyma podzolica]
MASLPPVPDDFTDHRYAVKHGVPLWLRVYPTDVNPAKTPRPWLLWIHGGAYCSGQHYHLRSWLLPLLHAAGVQVVSIAHRFTPHVSMEEMLEDCDDAFAWCRKNLGAVLAQRGGCATDKYGIGGDSAGGGLATLLAHRLRDPPARVVINVYGVTDMVMQQEIYDNQPLPDQPWQGDAPEETIRKIIDDRDPSHAVTATTNAWNLACLDDEVVKRGHDAIAQGLKGVWKVSDQEWRYNEGVKRQWDVKSYIGHHKLMVTLPLRLTTEMTTAERDSIMRKHSARHLVAKSDLGESYPPTVFLHGTADRAVPIDESKDMAAELRKQGVDVEELYCEGVDHGWDNMYSSPKDEGWSQFIAPIGRFVERHLCATS